MELLSHLAEKSSQELGSLVALDRHDNDDGSPFYFDAHQATWCLEQIDPATLGAFSGPEEARAWLDDELTMCRADGLDSRAAAYERMLAHGIDEPITVGRIGLQGRIWDGWHRTAIALIRGEMVPAIVGMPRRASLEPSDGPSP